MVRYNDRTVPHAIWETQCGLVNITHKDSARTTWLLTAHIVAQYSEALRKLTENANGTWSEQHRCHGLRLHPVWVCNTVRLGQDTT